MRPFLLKKLELDPDPVTLFRGVAGLPGSILLDSGMIMEGLSRYSFISADPFLVLTSRGDRIRIEKRSGPGAGEVETRVGNPLEILGELLRQHGLGGVQCPFPFFGGAAGYFAYDLGRRLERLPEKATDDVGAPEMWLGFYDAVAILDQVEGTVHLSSTGRPEDGPAGAARARERLEWLEGLITGCSPTTETTKVAISARVAEAAGEPAERAGLEKGTPLTSDFDRDGYCAVVERAREYIAAGDIFQVNLSQRFRLPGGADPWLIYRRLREINPAPMAAYLNCGDLQVVSASPERFLRLRSGLVETRPIKGTRPRGATPEEDRARREELWNSEKDRAELVMIVDLERNDLGRVCAPGSVRVPELYRLEEFPTVHHLVSTVEGRLEEGRDLVDLLKAAFPGGSITGAPKIRAMEIIEELEPVRRGIYCGSIGYLAFNGDADLNIVIRTLVFNRDSIYLQVGGGITIDSDPEAEYQETLDKARALANALGLKI